MVWNIDVCELTSLLPVKISPQPKYPFIPAAYAAGIFHSSNDLRRYYFLKLGQNVIILHPRHLNEIKQPRSLSMGVDLPALRLPRVLNTFPNRGSMGSNTLISAGSVTNEVLTVS
jgi:hypothetical protein